MFQKLLWSFADWINCPISKCLQNWDWRSYSRCNNFRNKIPLSDSHFKSYPQKIEHHAVSFAAQSIYLAFLTIFWRFLNFSHRLMPKWLRETMRKRYTTQYRLQPSQLIWDCPKWKPTTPSTSGCNLGLLSKTAFFSSTLERPQILSH